jgi:hypothetical protein
MNTHYFRHLMVFAAAALVMATTFSCTKSDRTATPDVIAGSWKLADVTIVNGEGGIHRTNKDLDGIGGSGMSFGTGMYLGSGMRSGSGVRFGVDRSFSINGLKLGTWMHENDVLAIKSLNGETIPFKLSSSADGAILLERDLPAAGGMSGAVVSYSLVTE